LEACPLTLGDSIMQNEAWRKKRVLIKKQNASILSDVKKQKPCLNLSWVA
jgi:hypothetical protein